jgi:hypothetical protein
MEHVRSLFAQQGIQLQQDKMMKYYPGSCDQCHMKKGGQKSIIHGLTPHLTLLICDKCYAQMERKIKSTIESLQLLTHYTTLPKETPYRILNEDGEIEEDWKIHPKYLFFIMKHHKIYIPMIKKGKKPIEIPLRSIQVLNDVKIL